VDNLNLLGKNSRQTSVVVVLFTDYLAHNGRYKMITGLLRD